MVLGGSYHKGPDLTAPMARITRKPRGSSIELVADERLQVAGRARASSRSLCRLSDPGTSTTISSQRGRQPFLDGAPALLAHGYDPATPYNMRQREFGRAVDRTRRWAERARLPASAVWKIHPLSGWRRVRPVARGGPPNDFFLCYAASGPRTAVLRDQPLRGLVNICVISRGERPLVNVSRLRQY
jgi:hypothetical protein